MGAWIHIVPEFLFLNEGGDGEGGVGLEYYFCFEWGCWIKLSIYRSFSMTFIPLESLLGVVITVVLPYEWSCRAWRTRRGSQISKWFKTMISG